MRKKFIAALAGIWYALTSDRGFRTQATVGLSGLAAVIYFGWPIRNGELAMMTVAAVLVLVTELQNSALERALDRLHPDVHDDIKHSKDMAAGAVLIAALFAFFVAISVIIF